MFLCWIPSDGCLKLLVFFHCLVLCCGRCYWYAHFFSCCFVVSFVAVGAFVAANVVVSAAAVGMVDRIVLMLVV